MLVSTQRSIIADEMHATDDCQSRQILHWALMPPGLPRLAARVDSLEEHLRLALTELRLLGGDASWMMREAEGAIELALQLLTEEWSGATLKPAAIAPVA